MAYRMLIVADAKSLQPATAETIRDYARGGGKVVFVSRTPDRAPGLRDAAAGDVRVKAASAAAVAAGAIVLPGPPEGGAIGELRTWTGGMLDRVRFAPTLSVASPRDGLYSLHHRAPDAELLFFANSYRRESSRSRVMFALGDSGLWRWDPETGARSPYGLPWDADGFEIDLRPLESVLLVTGPKGNPAPRNQRSGGRSESFVIETSWRVTFLPAPSGESFTCTMPALADFTASEDQRLRRFSGTAVYRTSFRLSETPYTRLDLGWDNDFICEVELNGRKLGVNWYGARLFDLRDVLRKGENELTIRYTTTLWNALGRNPPQPSGLTGPVRLRVIEDGGF